MEIVFFYRKIMINLNIMFFFIIYTLYYYINIVVGEIFTLLGLTLYIYLSKKNILKL